VAAPDLAEFLAGIDASAVTTDHEVLELVAAWDRLSSWASAQQLAAIAEFGRRPDVLGAEPKLAVASRAPQGGVLRVHPADEIGARLGVSARAASVRLGIAVALAAEFTTTAEALARGCIDLSKARVLVDECRHAAPEHLVALQARLLPRAPELTAPRLRTAAQHALMAVSATPSSETP
jgi:hypothetical protein